VPQSGFLAQRSLVSFLFTINAHSILIFLDYALGAGHSRKGLYSMRFSAITVLTASAIVLAGCASSSEDVSSAYISPLTYENYSCPQLQSELERISVRVHQVAGTVDRAATNDKIAMGVGLVIFWPALLMLKGNGPQHEELARLKGEYDAANEEMIHKNCAAGGTQDAAVTAPNSNMRPYAEVTTKSH